MDYDEAYWRYADVPNLERRLQEARDAAVRVERKIELRKAHLDEAEAAHERAKADIEAAEEALQVARDRVAEIPDNEATAAARAEVDQKNRMREAIVQALAGVGVATAGVAEGSGEANGDN